MDKERWIAMFIIYLFVKHDKMLILNFLWGRVWLTTQVEVLIKVLIKVQVNVKVDIEVYV